MASSKTAEKQQILHRRLLQDIAELQAKPYPNISLHVQDEDVRSACLILTPNGQTPLHLTVFFGQYPVEPPTVTMESSIQHPNVFNHYICATMLNTDDGWTVAYTMKAVALQLLSFFSSDKIEQDHGNAVVDLAEYQRRRNRYDNRSQHPMPPYQCADCKFGYENETGADTVSVDNLNDRIRTNLHVTAPTNDGNKLAVLQSKGSSCQTTPNSISPPTKTLQSMPDEVLLLMCSHLDIDELMTFARSWNRIGRTMLQYDLIRTRELQCFCLKQDFTLLSLGVGVNIVMRGRIGFLESEFDLLSSTAFADFHIRRSVQSIPFTHWMPLPITRLHWRRVQPTVHQHLAKIAATANIEPPTPVNVLYHFMNDVVVKFSQTIPTAQLQKDYPSFQPPTSQPQSTLHHASEKAIEAYFSLWHLLLCLATAAPAVVTSASTLITNFLSGQTDKTSCPNLGHLLVAILISSHPTSDDEKLTTAIIREAITRNVVWTLTSSPELSYMEPSAISDYRLSKTFEAGKTSYRLLMFLNLFRRTTQPLDQSPKTLDQLQDALFDAHGAPPHGTAARLANEIKSIQEVDSFNKFLAIMGVREMPTKSSFTAFLRQSVEESVKRGYSVWGLSQDYALLKRRELDPKVEVNSAPSKEWTPTRSGGGFFPGNPKGRGRGGRWR